MAGAGYRNWTAGDIPTATQFDTFLQEQTVMVFATAAARNAALAAVLAEGMITFQVDTNTLTVYSGAAWSTIGPVHGAWLTHTPTVTQSVGVAITVSNSTYMRVGRMVHWRWTVTVTGSGTAANVVTLSVPVNINYVGDFAECGRGQLFDTSATSLHNGGVVPAAAGSIKIQSTVVAPPNFLGASGFTAGLASGDVISGWCIYEAAADA